MLTNRLQFISRLAGKRFNHNVYRQGSIARISKGLNYAPVVRTARRYAQYDSHFFATFFETQADFLSNLHYDSARFMSETLSPSLKAKFVNMGNDIQSIACYSYHYSSFSNKVQPEKFNHSYRGPFIDQEKDLVRHQIGQLKLNEKISCCRGDPRPLSTLLVEGIAPKNPLGSLDILKHRHSNNHSGTVSFTFNVRAALHFGAKVSFDDTYGQSGTLRNGFFNIIGVSLSGDEYNIAGPGNFHEKESEATVGGPVKSEAIHAFRSCRLFKPAQHIVCGPIYVLKSLPETEKQQWNQLLTI